MVIALYIVYVHVWFQLCYSHGRYGDENGGLLHCSWHLMVLWSHIYSLPLAEEPCWKLKQITESRSAQCHFSGPAVEVSKMKLPKSTRVSERRISWSARWIEHVHHYYDKNRPLPPCVWVATALKQQLSPTHGYYMLECSLGRLMLVINCIIAWAYMVT